MEAIPSSETSVNKTSTRRHIPEDGNLQVFLNFLIWKNKLISYILPVSVEENEVIYSKLFSSLKRLVKCLTLCRSEDASNVTQLCHCGISFNHIPQPMLIELDVQILSCFNLLYLFVFSLSFVRVQYILRILCTLTEFRTH
jgi:hypothetical protein